MLDNHYVGALKQTSPSPQLHQLFPGDPPVTGEKKDFSLRSRHHYFGAVPLVVFSNQEGILLHLDQQKFPQCRTGFNGIGPCLGIRVDINIREQVRHVL